MGHEIASSRAPLRASSRRCDLYLVAILSLGQHRPMWGLLGGLQLWVLQEQQSERG